MGEPAAGSGTGPGPPEAPAGRERVDSALACLLILARYHGIAADAGQLRHRFCAPGQPLEATGFLRAARYLGLKARLVRCRGARLRRVPLPAVALLADSGSAVLARVEGDTLHLHNPPGATPPGAVPGGLRGDLDRPADPRHDPGGGAGERAALRLRLVHPRHDQYSSLLTWIVLGTLPAFALLSLGITPVFRARLNEKFTRGAEDHAFLVESITGIQTVKAMAVEPQMQRRWEEQLASYVRASFRTLHIGNVAGQLGSCLSKATTIVVLWVGAQAVMGGQLTVGELIAFNMLASRVISPVLRLVQVWQDLQQAGVSVARLGDLLNAPREPSGPSRTALPAIAGEVAVEQVTFRYQLDRPEALRDLSFVVPAGRVIGIVGRSGSGKSTIAKLIQRLYVPETGRILIDGMDLAQIDPTWLRRQIGVVLQENFLFNRPVRDNIALADPGLPLEAVVRAAKLAGAHEFIVGLPEGYDTLIGEHGCNLSGGQRQRIAIARALVTDPRILILDEATSALDYESEHIIQQNLAQICAGRTVFIIAHRLRTVRMAHQIFVIDQGRLIERGTHDELMRLGGYYARLHRLQDGSQPIAPPAPAAAEADAAPVLESSRRRAGASSPA